MFGVGLGGGPDVYPAPDGQHQGMSVEHVHLCIDVSRDGDAITGTVTVGDAEVRKFTGRLGLFSIVDDEIELIAPHRGNREIKDVDR